MFSAIADGFNWLFSLLWQVASFILNGLWSLLKPIFELIGAIFYALYKLGVVLVKILELVLMLARLLGGIVTGLFKTIAGLSYTGGASPLPASYSETIGHLQSVFTSLQFNKVAYLMQFAIWIATGVIALRLIGGMRGGGGSD